jgi:hypothetical protein
MDKNKIISLLKLLEDPDEKVFSIVKDEIVGHGELFKAYLENYHALSTNSLALERSEDILDEIFWESFETKLIEYFTIPEAKFFVGVFLIEKFFNRDIDTKELQTDYSILKTSIWIEMSNQLTNIEKINVLNTTLFDKLGYTKLTVKEIKSSTLSITYCISNKKFLPPNIAVLYCMLADEIQIPVFPINLPELFALCYRNADIHSEVFKNKSNDIIFFLFPSEKGAIISKDLANRHLERLKSKSQIKIDTTIDDIEATSYDNLLLNYFNIRIKSLKISNTDNFCTKYAKKVEDIFHEYL